MLNMLASLAECERELIADKLLIAKDAGAKGRTAEDAARLVGWSRVTYYRHAARGAAMVG